MSKRTWLLRTRHQEPKLRTEQYLKVGFNGYWNTLKRSHVEAVSHFQFCCIIKDRIINLCIWKFILYGNCIFRKVTVPRSCYHLKKLDVKKSGMYMIDPDGPDHGDPPFDVECDMKTGDIHPANICICERTNALEVRSDFLILIANSRTHDYKAWLGR